MSLEHYLKKFDMSGNTALVTGAAQGMGAAIARLLADSGARVVVADIQQDKARAVAQDICAAGGTASAFTFDAGDEQAILALFTYIETELGQLDLVVNNAGSQDRNYLEDTSSAYWDRLMAVNLRGPALITREAVRMMRARGKGGSIVNIASNSAMHATAPSLYAYSTSKAGVVGLTRATAMEVVKDGIRVNAVCPGNTTTEGQMTASGPAFPPEQIAAFLPPIGRTGTPDDIASAVHFLLSDAASFITGQTLVVDGGMLSC